MNVPAKPNCLYNIPARRSIWKTCVPCSSCAAVCVAVVSRLGVDLAQYRRCNRSKFPLVSYRLAEPVIYVGNKLMTVALALS